MRAYVAFVITVETSLVVFTGLPVLAFLGFYPKNFKQLSFRINVIKV